MVGHKGRLFRQMDKELWMTKRKCWTTALCLGLMTLLGAHSLHAAPSEREQWLELKAKMQAEGWEQIADSVFERQRGDNKVEHLGYGPKGLSWTIGKLKRQLDALRLEYQNYPSEDLARIIDELSIKIAEARRELRGMPRGLSNINAYLAGASCSNICYSATADAYHLTSTQGVAAVAEAKFNSTCGYSGETYAYAYARATLNGTTTTVTQSDPDSGTSIISNAAASVNGGSISGTTCYSTANSYAQSSTLGISYSTSDTNDNYCPAPAMAVTITGSTWEYFTNYSCRNVTWYSSISGGVSPYTYQWTYNGTAVGTGSTYTRSVCGYDGGFTLGLTVTGSNSASASDTHYVDVYWEQWCGDYLCSQTN
jgi:hypothetical protein